LDLLAQLEPKDLQDLKANLALQDLKVWKVRRVFLET
jgi:hypothetical protein